MLVVPVGPKPDIAVFRADIHPSALKTLVYLQSLGAQRFMSSEESSLTVEASAQYPVAVDDPVSFENSFACRLVHFLKSPSLPYYFLKDLGEGQGGSKDGAEHNCPEKEEERRGKELNEGSLFL